MCELMLTDILPEIEKSVLDTEPDGVFLLPAMPKGSYRVINEGSGFVPLSWKILASVDTQVHEQVERVELWPLDEDGNELDTILVWRDRPAIAGNFQEGLARLEAFLSKIEQNSAEPLVNDSLNFLRQPEIARKYILIDPSETLHWDDPITNDSINKAFSALRTEIENVELEMQKYIQENVQQRISTENNHAELGLTGWYGRNY